MKASLFWKHILSLTGFLFLVACHPSSVLDQYSSVEVVTDIPATAISPPASTGQSQAPQTIDYAETEKPTEIGILLTMFDGQAIDDYHQQPISSIFCLDGEGNLYHIYTPPTHNGMGESYDVSPDGQWIIFSQEDPLTRQSDLYKMRTNGTELVQLTDTSTQEGEARWAPNGQSIIYVAWNTNPNQAKIARIDVNGVFLEEFPFTAPSIRGLNWSPDGQWISFSALDPQKQVEKLYILKVVDKEVDKISQELDSGRKGIWSPDGQSLAFTVREGARDRVYIYDLTTKRAVPTAQEAVDLWQVWASAWSPDSRFVVLNGGRVDTIDKFEVWLWDTQTQTLKSLTQDTHYPMIFLSWSPNAQQMLLSAIINGPEIQLHILDLLTNEIRPIEGIPYLNFGVTLLKWDELAVLPENVSPLVSNIQVLEASNPVTLSPTLDETPIVKEMTVIALSTIKVRSGPGTAYPIIGEIGMGESLSVSGVSIGQDWLQVHFADSVTGFAWVYAALTDYDAKNTSTSTP